MAGERIGKTYEALLKVVLDYYKSKQQLKDTVFWNETPTGLTVEPDFLIGKDKDHPNLIIMVTHSGCANNSLMKSWRNLGELCEIKTTLDPAPKAINVLFDSIIESSLKLLQDAAFDGQIIVGDRPYYDTLQKWVRSTEPLLPTDQTEKAAAIERALRDDHILEELVGYLYEDVKVCIDNSEESLSELWELEYQRRYETTITAKNTYVRRGLSKLLIFEDTNLGIDLYSRGSLPINSVPEYILELGLARKAIGKIVPNDEEIMGAVRLLKREDIFHILDSVKDSETLNGYLGKLRSIPNYTYIGKYIIENYHELINPEFFYKCAQSLYENPASLKTSEDAPACWPPNDVWLVSYTMELIKENTGKANGFGTLQLARETIENGFGSVSDLTSASQFAGGFGFMSWIIRKPSPFRDDLIKGISFTLAHKLQEIGFEKARQLIQSKRVQNRYISNLIEAKLCAYTPFSPLYELLKISIPECEKKAIKACFAEKAGLRGQTGNTTVAVANHTIINWQTATEAGRDHKRKELCGRAVGLRYSWDSINNTFIKRPDINKLILLLDGTWRQKDVDVLIKAGWDEIYYPDEMDKLKEAII